MSEEQLITLTLTEKQLATIVSGLLFSCSVNVVSNTNEEYQRELFELAKTIKTGYPAIKLPDIQFLKEDYYEDDLSPLVYDEFGTNMELLTFDEV
jgi:hypothetical protein